VQLCWRAAWAEPSPHPKPTTARIAPTNLELAPGPKVRKEPGPVLRLREGRPYDTEMSGLMKDTLSIRGHSFAEVNFIASVPGPTSSTAIIRIMWMMALQD